MDSGIACDPAAWLGYWDACVDGLRAGSPAVPLFWAGPGTGGDTQNSIGPGSWVLPALVKHLEARKKATGSYGLDSLQWHMKGALPGQSTGSGSHAHHTASCNAIDDLTIVEHVRRLSPALAAAVPMGNEEVDPLGGWQHQVPWRGDARDAAAIVRVLAMHQDMLVANKSLGVRWGYHANDNAFLNYGDAWFQQRTLVVRFEMNLTHTVEVLCEPAINLTLTLT